jgi:hypothetical protein
MSILRVRLDLRAQLFSATLFLGRLLRYALPECGCTPTEGVVVQGLELGEFRLYLPRVGLHFLEVA